MSRATGVALVGLVLLVLGALLAPVVSPGERDLVDLQHRIRPRYSGNCSQRLMKMSFGSVRISGVALAGRGRMGWFRGIPDA